MMGMRRVYPFRHCVLLLLEFNVPASSHWCMIHHYVSNLAVFLFLYIIILRTSPGMFIAYLGISEHTLGKRDGCHEYHRS